MPSRRGIASAPRLMSDAATDRPSWNAAVPLSGSERAERGETLIGALAWIRLGSGLGAGPEVMLGDAVTVGAGVMAPVRIRGRRTRSGLADLLRRRRERPVRGGNRPAAPVAGDGRSGGRWLGWARGGPAAGTLGASRWHGRSEGTLVASPIGRPK